MVQRALEAAAERLYQETDDAESSSPDSPAGQLEDVSPGQRRADAIGAVSSSALARTDGLSSAARQIGTSRVADVDAAPCRAISM